MKRQLPAALGLILAMFVPLAAAVAAPAAGALASHGPAPPINDNFSGRIVISSSLPQSDPARDTLDATEEGTDPNFTCASNNQGYRTVWYEFTPTVTRYLGADTLGSEYDTVLAIWTGSPGSFSVVACNDDVSFGVLQSSVQVSVAALTTYYIEVASFSDNEPGQTLTLNIDYVTFKYYLPAVVNN